jgi:hypothetical protein
VFHPLCFGGQNGFVDGKSIESRVIHICASFCHKILTRNGNDMLINWDKYLGKPEMHNNPSQTLEPMIFS